MFNQTFQLQANMNSPSKLIFIVEDDEEIGNLLLQIIEQETIHKAIHHVDARKALKAATQVMPQLLLLDYSLPDMNGLELYDWLQSFEHLKNIPTILMSARNPPIRRDTKTRYPLFTQAVCGDRTPGHHQEVIC